MLMKHKRKAPVSTQSSDHEPSPKKQRVGSPTRSKSQFENKKKLKHMSTSDNTRKKKSDGKSRSKKKILPVVKLPKNPSEYSSNWLKLMQSMPGTKRKKEVKSKKSPENLEKDKAPVKEVKPEIWFDDVDEIYLDKERPKAQDGSNLVKDNAYTGVTKVVAMDCEMVGVGENGDESILARVSLVNSNGHCIYDKYVKATEPVVDYRTAVSGIRPEDMQKGEEFVVVQKEVSDILKGRVLVGHAVHHDLKVLFLSHPQKMLRDTSKFSLFKSACGTSKPSLRKLSEKVLHVKVQSGEHNSVEDAQAAMRLYMMYKVKWEKELKQKGIKVSKKARIKKEAVS